MSQEQLFGIIRSVLAIAGSYLLGHTFLDSVIDPALWEQIAGTVLIIASFVWSFFSKQLTIEIVQSSLLKVVTVVGTIAVASGKITGDLLNGLIMLATALAPIIYSFLSKQKSAEIEQGEIYTSELAK